MRYRLTLGLLSFVLAVSMAAKSQNSQRLPSFELVNASGVTAAIQDLAPKGKWLLIYVKSDSRPSELTLSRLKADKYRPFLSRIIIIVGGLKPAELTQFTSKYPDLASANWYVDPERQVFQKLDLHGLPAELGLKDNEISWALGGMLGDSAAFDSTLLTWVKAN